MKRPVWTYPIRHFCVYLGSDYTYLRFSPFGFGIAASTRPVFSARQRKLFEAFGFTVSWFRGANA
jgi:hypothetical protein